MKAKAIWKKGMFFECTTPSGHIVKLDYSADGDTQGPTPMENFLVSAGACSGMDVVSILQKKKVVIDEFTIIMKADRAKDYPKIFNDITYEYIVRGMNIKEKDVKHAISLSFEKYCSIIAMVKDNVNVDYAYTIL